MSVYGLIHTVHASVGKLTHKVFPTCPSSCRHSAVTLRFRKSLKSDAVEGLENKIHTKPKGHTRQLDGTRLHTYLNSSLQGNSGLFVRSLNLVVFMMNKPSVNTAVSLVIVCVHVCEGVSMCVCVYVCALIVTPAKWALRL